MPLVAIAYHVCGNLLDYLVKLIITQTIQVNGGADCLLLGNSVAHELFKQNKAVSRVERVQIALHLLGVPGYEQAHPVSQR